MRSSRSTRSAGFTIVEVAVVTPVVMVIILGIFALITALLQSSAAERVGAQNLYDVHTALGRIEADASLASAFIPYGDDNLPDTKQPVPSDGWSFKGSGASTRTLILRSFATTENPLSNNRRPVFFNDQGCDADTIFYNEPLTYNTVYFVQGTTLYRRLIIAKPKPTCNEPFQKQTCQPGDGCPADDETIATNVSSFTIDYYPDSATDTKSEAYTDSTGDQEVEASNSIGVTINLNRRAYGQPLTNGLTLRISKLITGNTDD